MKKKVALSATAVAVLASVVPAQVAPVNAEELKEVVYTQFTSGNENHAGNGTDTNPYNLFADALANVADGGTIIVKGSAFLNDVNNDSLPFYINKNVTIKAVDGTQASLSIRPAGIVLGGNLTLENIALSMDNIADDSIFVNGHTLNMTNVTRYGQSRLVDIFAGTYNHSTNLSYNMGEKSIINITTNDKLSGTTELGNIYAGSMLGDFNKEVEINLTNTGSTGKLQVLGIKGSGAEQPITKNWFDTTEPEAPVANPNQFRVNANVTVNLDKVFPSVDGNTGGTGKVSINATSKYSSTLPMKNIHSLAVQSGTVKAGNLTSNDSLNRIDNVHLAEGTALDLTGVNRNFTVDNYSGNGTVILRTDAAFRVNNETPTDSTLNLAVQEYFNGASGKAIENNVYLNTPASTKVTYNPHATQSYLTVHPVKSDGRLEWTVMDSKKVPTEPQPEPDEPEVGDPVLTEITAEQSTQSISMSNFEEGDVPTAKLLFNMVTNPPLDNMVGFDQFNPTIKVGGQEARLVNDDGNISYRVDGLDLNIYFQPDEGDDLQLQQMVVEFLDEGGQPAVPTQDTYEFEISTEGVDPLELTLTVEGLEEEDPTPDEVGPDPEPALPAITGIEFTNNSHTVQRNSEPLSVDYDFTVTADTGTVDLTQYPLTFTFDGVQATHAEGTNTYTVEDKGITIEVSDGHIQVRGTTEDLEVRSYPITMSVDNTNISKELTLVIQDKPAQPTITKFTAVDATTKTITNDNPNTFFEFKVDVTGDLKPLDEYSDFKITINGEETGKVTQDGDDKVYFTSYDSWVKAYIEYEESTGKHKLVLQPFSNEGPAVPTEEEYTVTLSYGEDVQPLTFTVNVQEEEEPSIEPPAPPVVTKPTITALTLVSKYIKEVTHSEFSSEFFEFDVKMSDDSTAELLSNYEDLDVTINGNPVEVITEDGLGKTYINRDQNIKVYFELDETTGRQKMNVTTVEGELLPVARESKYAIHVTHPDLDELAMVTILNVAEELEEPVVTSVEFPDGDTKRLETENMPMDVELPVRFNIENFISTLTFRDLGYTLTINGEEANYDERLRAYVAANKHLAISVVRTEDLSQFKLLLQQLDSNNSGYLNLREGNYNIEAKGPKDFNLTFILAKPTPPTPPTGGGNNGGSSTGGSNNGGNSGTTPEPVNPPSGGSGNTPTPEPEKPKEEPAPTPPPSTGTLTPPPTVEQPTPVPPQQEETKPTRPTSKPQAVASKPEAIEKLPEQIQQKVDSLMTEVLIQEKGTVIDLTGDGDDLSSVSTLEVTNEGVFANVDGERVKFSADLNIGDTDWDNLRIIRADGSPVPHKPTVDGFTITTGNFSDILITERVTVPFKDVSKDDWYYEYVDEAFNLGVTTGTTATTFSPNDKITRAQAAVLVARMYELKPTSETPTLTDTADAWYAEEVQALVDNGIIKGYGDGTFRGEQEITREQLSVILHRLAQQQGQDTSTPKDEIRFTDTSAMSDEGKTAIEYMASQGIVNYSKDLAFKPKSDATRAQVTKMLVRFGKSTDLY